MMAKPLTILWPLHGSLSKAPVRFVLLLSFYATASLLITDWLIRSLGFFRPTRCDPASTGGIVVAFFIGPLIETVVQALLFESVLRWTRRESVALVAASVLMASTHSVLEWSWGLVVLTAFVLYSYAYKYLRQQSITNALTATFVVHALANILVSIWGELVTCS